MRYLIVALAIAGAGCASFETNRMARGAAAAVGCPATEITVSEDNHNPGTRVFAATCKGQKFYCTEYPFDPSRPTTCTKALTP